MISRKRFDAGKLAVMVASLNGLKTKTVRDADDAALHDFEALCGHWQKAAVDEIKKRKAK
jgi:hypothetical protein